MKNKKKNTTENKVKEKHQVAATPSASSFGDAPDDSFELINKYGTYEIQPTADTDNKFPAIAQGFSEKEQKREYPDNQKEN